jgi:hypothetical protein
LLDKDDVAELDRLLARLERRTGRAITEILQTAV